MISWFNKKDLLKKLFIRKRILYL